jgi:hypothetical protein
MHRRRAWRALGAWRTRRFRKRSRCAERAGNPGYRHARRSIPACRAHGEAAARAHACFKRFSGCVRCDRKTGSTPSLQNVSLHVCLSHFATDRLLAAASVAPIESTHLKFSSRARLEESLLNPRAARKHAFLQCPNTKDPAEPGAIHDMKET